MRDQSGVYMISQLGSHVGKQVIFGFDRYIVPELSAYTRALSPYGIPVPTVATSHIHYLTSAEKVCEAIQGRDDRIGVLVCATGMGMSIAANKFRGIYAARCVSEEDGKLARVINNANVLCLAANSGIETNQTIIDAFMRTPYRGRKLEQLEYITQMELETEEESSPRGEAPSVRVVSPYSRRSA